MNSGRISCRWVQMAWMRAKAEAERGRALAVEVGGKLMRHGGCVGLGVLLHHAVTRWLGWEGIGLG